MLSKGGYPRLFLAGLLMAFAVIGLGCSSATVYGFDTDNSGFMTFGLGEVGIRNSVNQPRLYSMEFRSPPTGGWGIAASAGIAGVENGAYFFYISAQKGFRLGNRWILVPSFGPALFSDSAQEDLGLGHAVEFRSGLELVYQFANGYRAGFALHHLSNGGISGKNPGTETLTLSLSIPLNYPNN